MSTNQDFMQFLDPEILKRLKSMGLVPPQKLEDFIQLEQKLKNHTLDKPENLKDPFAFLSRDPKKNHYTRNSDLERYEQNLAFAARDGKSIPDYIKERMKEDKKNRKKNENDK